MPIDNDKLSTLSVLAAVMTVIFVTLGLVWSWSVAVAGLACMVVGGLVSVVIRTPTGTDAGEAPQGASDAALSELREQLSRAETLLAQADRQPSATAHLISGMGHEIRTPLHSIIGYTEMIEEILAERNVSESIPDLRRIRTAADQLLRRMSDVIVLSGLDDGSSELFWDTFEVSSLLDEVGRALEPELARRQNELTIEAPSRPGRIATDRGKLRHILTVLISFASQATTQGEVHLTVRRKLRGEHAFLFFEIADDGVGLDTGKIAVISAESAAATLEGGDSELGLVIVRRYVELLGGELSTLQNSRAKGRFLAVVPDWRSHRSTKQSDNRRVLVVDDAPQAAAARGVLYAHGFDLIVADDVVTAQREIIQGGIDRIVVNMELDEVWTVVEAARRNELPVLGIAEQALRVEAVKRGLSAFLQKPFDPWTFTRTIQQIAPARRPTPAPPITGPLSKKDLLVKS